MCRAYFFQSYSSSKLLCCKVIHACTPLSGAVMATQSAHTLETVELALPFSFHVFFISPFLTAQRCYHHRFPYLILLQWATNAGVHVKITLNSQFCKSKPKILIHLRASQKTTSMTCVYCQMRRLWFLQKIAFQTTFQMRDKAWNSSNVTQQNQN